MKKFNELFPAVLGRTYRIQAILARAYDTSNLPQLCGAALRIGRHPHGGSGGCEGSGE